MSRSRRIWFITLIILLFALAEFIAVYTIESRLIDFEDPLIGETIRVKKATLLKPGYIVIKKRKYIVILNKHEFVIAASHLLQPGYYSDIELPFLYGENNVVYNVVYEDERKDEMELEKGDKLVAFIYEDDGDGVFDEGRDRSITNLFGRPIRKVTFIKNL